MTDNTTNLEALAEDIKWAEKDLIEMEENYKEARRVYEEAHKTYKKAKQEALAAEKEARRAEIIEAREAEKTAYQNYVTLVKKYAEDYKEPFSFTMSQYGPVKEYSFEKDNTAVNNNENSLAAIEANLKRLLGL